jgi:nitroreductase
MARWRAPAQWLDRDGSPGPLLQACLAAATAAPSVHNTQPWLFHLHGDSVDVSADPDRQLGVIDLTGREQLISVGAALFNLRAQLLARGWLPVQALWPAAGRDGPAGRIAPGMPVPAPRAAKAFAWAIPRRHSNRGPFRDAALPDNVVTALVRAARAEGAVLRFADPETRAGLFGLVHTAERRWADDPAYRHELGRWTGQRPGRRDGIPAAAVGPRVAGTAVPLRDLGLARGAAGCVAGDPAGDSAGEPARAVARFEADPAVAVLYTGDGPYEWLRAGQALQRVLLTATVWGVAATLMTQPLEIPSLRDLIADPATGRAAQAIIRFGYPLQPAVASPRRPWREVLRTA